MFHSENVFLTGLSVSVCLCLSLITSQKEVQSGNTVNQANIIHQINNTLNTWNINSNNYINVKYLASEIVLMLVKNDDYIWLHGLYLYDSICER